MVGAIRASLVIVGAVLSGVMALTPAGSAETGATGRDFGKHVVTCAQTMGFSGQHNPGMHRGFAGWNPAETC